MGMTGTPQISRETRGDGSPICRTFVGMKISRAIPAGMKTHFTVMLLLRFQRQKRIQQQFLKIAIPTTTQSQASAWTLRNISDTCSLLHPTHWRVRLRSAHRGDLCVPSTSRELGKRSFRVAAPRTWNSLPLHLRSPTISQQQFQSGLKTHLFKRAYIWLLPPRTIEEWTYTYLLTKCGLTSVPASSNGMETGRIVFFWGEGWGWTSAGCVGVSVISVLMQLSSRDPHLRIYRINLS